MSDPTWQLIAIVLFFAVMVGVGVWSFTRTGDKGDYMLGGRGLGPVASGTGAGSRLSHI